MEETRTLKGNSRKRRERIFLIYRVIFFFVIIWFVGSSLFGFIIGHLVDTQIIVESVIEKKYPTMGYIIRDEVTVSSPVTGRIISKVNTGERVGLDMPLFVVEGTAGTALELGEPITVNAPMAGVVTYVTDGLETIFWPNLLESLDMEKIEDLKADIIDNNKADVVEKGKRFCKIVNNLEGLQIYLEFPLDTFEEPLQEGQELNLFFPEINNEVKSVIIDLKGIANNAQVLVKLPEVWYSLLNKRTQKVELIIEKRTGIILPKKVLVINNNDETGVYWLRKGFVFWQPVEIISEDGDNILIEGLEQFTEVILNPGLVKEGQHIN
ncbi:MAG: hypothetical protein JM58_10350 [Peptococcaceae bacterium BICA1-8]|nr:MAG: hypothetical protein JM58_10350 [Peptococcaceae bacterium BICA1-8]